MRTIVAALVAVSLSLAFHACSDRRHMAQEIEDEPGDGGADAAADR